MPIKLKQKRANQKQLPVKLKWPVDYKVKIKMLKHKIQNTHKSILRFHPDITSDFMWLILHFPSLVLFLSEC